MIGKMLLRIAGIFILSLGTASLAFAEFITPELPRESRGVYRFDAGTKSNAGIQSSASSTRPNSSFKITVGFSRSAIHSFNEGYSHHDRAKELVERLQQRFESRESPDVQVSVDKIYSGTGELLLNVQVADVSELDQARVEVIAFLKKTPGVFFASSPARVRAE
jgi:hypothetical protein